MHYTCCFIDFYLQAYQGYNSQLINCLLPLFYEFEICMVVTLIVQYVAMLK